MKKVSEMYSGKAKSVYSTESDEHLIMVFRDDTSAFDGKKVAQLAHKGNVNNQFNAFIMEKLAAAGIPVHFEKMLSVNESLVKRLKMIPLECVVRNRAAGSLCRRLGVEEGLALEPPVFELFLKNDSLGDPMVNEAHALTFGWATQQQLDQMRDLTLAVNDVLKKLFENAGILLVDYKLEFGMFGDQMMLGDEFSPDGCRLWDQATLEKLDKDRFRQDLGGVVEAYQQVGERLGLKFTL